MWEETRSNGAASRRLKEMWPNCSMCKELVIEDKEKAEVLSASFASGFYC